MIPKLRIREVSIDESPFSVFSRIYDQHEYAYLLESLEGPSRLARYSFIGFDPDILIRAKGDRVTISEHGERMVIRAKDPLQLVENYVMQTANDGHLPFMGGAVGYISYEAVGYWETLPRFAISETPFPTIEFGIFSKGIIFDHRNGRVFQLSAERENWINHLISSEGTLGRISYSAPSPNISKREFEEMVERAKQYIYAGDIFQVVLSRRYQFNISGDLRSFYRALRDLNPSPYMYFLKFGDTKIVGSSPEMLVRVKGGKMEMFPIAGTRPLLHDPRMDEKLRRELLSDPKELAEHVMLVDLARNDLGRVAQYGSIKVPELMGIRRFSHVQHIVSRVTGRLRPGKTSFDVLRAVFPAGTVTGAPKIRAMQIIAELERVQRGPYAGAVGYFSFNGNADFAIAIRTLFARGNLAYVQTGAGIVADSVPEREWLETEYKAMGLLEALRLAGEA